LDPCSVARSLRGTEVVPVFLEMEMKMEKDLEFCVVYKDISLHLDCRRANEKNNLS
jgi:chorismate mutase